MSQLGISKTKSEPATLDVFASVRFFGDALEPARITETLNTAPTLAYCKGEVYKKSRGHEVRGRTGLWLISSEGRMPGQDLNDHLEYLLGVLFPSRDNGRLTRLQEVMRSCGIEADVSCFWYGERGARPPVIRADICERFARIPAVIETDFNTD